MTTDRRTLVVVNPASGNGKTGERWPAMERLLRAGLPGLEVARTQGHGHATRITRDALTYGVELVLSLGGDGTHNEVVNGFFDERGELLDPRAAYHPLPGGTGGDFRKTLGLGKELDGYLSRITADEQHPVDVGRLTYVDHAGRTRTRHFLNITSFGIGGVVDHHVNRSTKLFGGKISFLIGSAKALVEYRNKPISLSLDGGPAEDLVINNVAVANGRFFGGGMMVAPEARLDDGRFDVVIFGDLSKPRMLTLSSRIYEGTHLSLEGVTHHRATTVHATSSDEVLLDMDGEQPGRLPATFEIVPRALRLQGPPPGGTTR